jgi:hypothetical protein
LVHVLAPVLAVGFLVGSVFAWRGAMRDREHERRAVRAQGVVTQVEYSSEQQVFPTVRFQAADGQLLEAKPASSVNASLFAVGQPVGLRYDPQQPSWIAVDGLPSSGCVGVAAAVLLSLGTIALAVLTLALILV